MIHSDGQINFIVLKRAFASFLGISVRCDVYLRNPFRLMGVPVGIDQDDLERQLQRIRVKAKLNPNVLKDSQIKTGYDEVFEARKPLESLSVFGQDPCQRLLWECLWFDLPSHLFGKITDGNRALPSNEFLDKLYEIIEVGGDNTYQIERALAIVYHNAAISHEFGCVAPWGREDCWKKALFHWAKVISSDNFWEYLTGRIRSIDDPRLKVEDLEKVKNELPLVITGFNKLFAQAYTLSGQMESAAYHVQLIANCDMPERAKKTILREMTEFLTQEKLTPIVNNASSTFEALTSRVNYDDFEKICEPLYMQAKGVISLILEEFMIPDKYVETRLFDPFCNVLLESLGRVMDYQGESRNRNLLASALWAKRLLEFPISDATKAKIVESIKADTRYLYKDLLADKTSIDPTACWFMDGAEADPASSLEIALYHLKSVNFYTNIKILVPRSKKAKHVHEGKAKADDIFLPPSSWQRPVGEYKPITLVLAIKADSGAKKRCEIKSLLEVLEYYLTCSTHIFAALKKGRLSEWLRKIGQSGLASILQDIKDDASDLNVHIGGHLLVAARDEVDWTVEKIKEQEKVKIREIEARTQQSLKGQAESLQDKIAEKNRECADELRKIKAYLSKKEQKLKSKLQQINSKKEEQIRLVDKKYQASMEKARKEVAMARKRHSGAVGLLVCLIFSISISGIALLVLKQLQIIARFGLLHLNITLGFGMATGIFYNWICIRRAKKKQINIRKEGEKEKDEIEIKTEERIQQVNREFEGKTSSVRARLAALNNQIEKIKQRGDALLEQIRKEHEALVAEVRSQTQADITKIKEKLQTAEKELLSRFRVKPEETKYEFPAYKAAKQKGFKDGNEPNEWEIKELFDRESNDMLRMLNPLSRELLGKIFAFLPDEEKLKLVAHLIELPPSKRDDAIMRLLH